MIRIQCSTLSNLNNFFLCRKRCTATIKPKSLLMILQSLQFIPFCVQKMILCQIVATFSRKRFLSITLRTSSMKRTSWPMEILLVVLLSSLKLLQKSDRSTENVITFPDPKKNQSAFPITIITVFLMNSIILITFCTQTICDKKFQQLLCHSSTLMINTLCPISTLNRQLTNLEQTHIRCSLHCQQWTVKGRDFVSVLNSFIGITYQTEEWT